MTRLFAFNSLAGCKRTGTGVADGHSTAGRFDSTYVSSGIAITGNTDFIESPTPMMDGSTSVGRLWNRFDWYNATGGNTNNTLWEAKTSAGANAYKIYWTGSNSINGQYWNGSSWTNFPGPPAAFNMNTATLYNMTIDCNAAAGTLTVYQGNTVVFTGTAVSSFATTVGFVRFYNNGNGGATVLSQVMGADYDIRDAKLMPLAFNGNSATNTSGTGAYTDINETVLDETTNIIISSVGGKKGQTKAALTLPGTYGIAGMVVSARGRVSGGTVTDGKLGVKSGASSSSSTGRTFNGGYEPRSAIFESDPNTSGAWTQTNFNNAETYLEAA